MVNIKIEKKITNWKLSTLSPKFIEHHAIKRPKELLCHIHHVKIKGEAWTIIVGLVENKPYEVFGGLSKFIEIPKKYKTGTLIKNGKVNGVATYNLSVGEHDDQLLVKDIVNAFENTTQGAFTRIISLSLRHGTPINFVVEQLSKDQHSDITSFSKVIARVFKNYISTDIKALKCDECNSSNTIFEQSCMKCLDCGVSKCG